MEGSIVHLMKRMGDDRNGGMDEEERNVYLIIGFSVLGLKLTIISFGLVGNIISLAVWSRPNLKSSSSVVLLALAVCDTLVILCGLWFHYQVCYEILKQFKGDKTLNPTDLLYNYYTQCSFLLSGNIYEISVTASMYLTVTITVERYICVSHPFQFRDWCSYSRTYKLVVIIIFFSFVYKITHFWRYSVVSRSYLVEGENITYYKISGGKKGAARLKYTWMFLCIDYLLPLTCIIALNTITYIKVKRMNTKRRGMTDPQKNENKLTTMLIYVALEFVVFTSFNGFISMTKIFPDITHYVFSSSVNHGTLLYEVQFVFNSINSSVNFLTYVFSWPPFRKTFIKMFCSHKEPTLGSPENSNQAPV